VTATADNVTIQRLSLRAQAHWQYLIQPRLEQMQWPELGADEYLFIQRLSLTTSDVELEANLSARVRELAAQAADGQWPQAESAPVVRFSSYARLLVTLTQDIFKGEAEHRWFWREWQQLYRLPPTEAITQLWVGEPLHMVEICAQLAANDSLAMIWPQLSPAQFQRLSLALAQSAGFSLEAKSQAGVAPSLMPPQPLLQRWARVVAPFGADHSAVQLVAILTLLEWRPDLLMSASSTEAVRITSERLAHTALSTSPAVSKASGVQESAVEDAEQEAVKVVPPGPLDSERPAPHPTSDLTEPVFKAEHGVAVGEANESAAAQKSAEERPAEITPLDIFGQHEFTTQWGGLFYYLNFLNQSESLELIHRSGGFEVLQGGWGWLHQLGLAIGMEADPSLKRFISNQLGMDDPTQLDDLPPLPNREAFVGLLQQRYERLQPWDSRVLANPAWITATASHLDINFQLQSVDLDIRLAGLDINPGWLPWLGRVVNFHYLENPFATGGTLQ